MRARPVSEIGRGMVRAGPRFQSASRSAWMPMSLPWSQERLSDFLCAPMAASSQDLDLISGRLAIATESQAACEEFRAGGGCQFEILQFAEAEGWPIWRVRARRSSSCWERR